MTRPIHPFLALSLALATQAQSADCPTADALASGIRFGLSSGETETFRRLENGLVEAKFEAPDAYVSRALLGQGIYLLELVDLVDGQPDPATRATYSYPVDPSELPLPDPAGSWAAKVAVFEGGELETEHQAYSFGTETTAGFEGCSYTMIPIEIVYGSGSDRDTLHYLPELGLAYLAAATYDGSTDLFSYVSITALP